ncbi:hypothetical protein M0812_24980 [Anaeramoeba flamelloides]|uniref:Uncharacterized protein n=1 Tax=Anaeramoeba flamelloides TaxID=1746091 RepID=A0AAV7YQA5_9EUKA|nr:hypothetical protein M0812_24980 [Anaeramoeba flamelloides]
MKTKQNPKANLKQKERSRLKVEYIIAPRVPKPSRTRSRARKGLLKMCEMTNLQLESWRSMTQREQEILRECKDYRNDHRIETFQKHFPEEFAIKNNEKGEMERVTISSRLLLALSVATQTGSSNLRSTLSSYFNRKGLIRNPNNPKFRKGACLDFINKKSITKESSKNVGNNRNLNKMEKNKKIKPKNNRFNPKKYKILFPTKRKFSKNKNKTTTQKETNKFQINNENKSNSFSGKEKTTMQNRKRFQNGSRAKKGSFVPKEKHTEAWNSFSQKEQEIFLKGKDLKRLNQRLKLFEKNFQKPHLVVLRDENFNLIKVEFSSTFLAALQFTLKQGSSGVRNAWRLFFLRKGLKITKLYNNETLTFSKIDLENGNNKEKKQINNTTNTKVSKNIQWSLNDNSSNMSVVDNNNKKKIHHLYIPTPMKMEIEIEKVKKKENHFDINFKLKRKRKHHKFENQTRDEKLIEDLNKFEISKRKQTINPYQLPKSKQSTNIDQLAYLASLILEHRNNQI